MEVQLPAGRNTGTAQIFWVPQIISGTSKAMNFKFGRYIYTVHPNKSPWKIWKKRERGRIQRLPKFFEYPLLFQERVKLYELQIWQVYSIWEKRERGRIQRLSKFFEYPLLSQERVLATNFKFCVQIHRIDRNKSPLKISALSRGRTQGLEIFRAPTYRAHRAVVFAIAQLSCYRSDAIPIT